MHSRGVRAELALKGVAVVCWDLGLGDQLGHLLSDAACEVPHVAISLRRDRGMCGRAGDHPPKSSPDFPCLTTAQQSCRQSIRANHLPLPTGGTAQQLPEHCKSHPAFEAVGTHRAVDSRHVTGIGVNVN